MNRGGWNASEVRRYLALEDRHATAVQIAAALHRSIPMVNEIRRKQVLAERSGAKGEDLVRLLLHGEQELRTGVAPEEPDRRRDPRVGTSRKPVRLVKRVARHPRPSGPQSALQAFVAQHIEEMKEQLFEQIYGALKSRDNLQWEVGDLKRRVVFLEDAILERGRVRTSHGTGHRSSLALVSGRKRRVK